MPRFLPASGLAAAMFILAAPAGAQLTGIPQNPANGRTTADRQSQSGGQASVGPRALIREDVRGAVRFCFYASPTLRSPRPPRPTDEAMVRVGLGEPCPYYLSPAAQRRIREQRQGPRAIPSFATLVRTERRGTLQTCVYRYLGQEYSRPAPPSGNCDLTPHLQ
jgi:hypothetical protein